MIWLGEHFLVIVGVALTLLAAIFVLQQRRTPQSTAAWLLAIVLLPYVAIPLFLALGFRKQGSRFPRVRFERAQRGERGEGGVRANFRSYGLPAATPGNAFTLLGDGTGAYVAMMRLVEEARDSLDVTFYLIADDAVGRAFVEALERRARAGVSVRLIIDRLGNLWPPTKALRRLRAAGGELRYFSPIVHAPDRGHLNLRNHRKMVIADGTRVFAGGMNVADEYMGPEQNPKRWVDLSFCLEGPTVQVFADLHASDWESAGAENACKPRQAVACASVGETCTQLVPSGPDMDGDALHDVLVNAIHNAQERVWVVTPYFLPTELLGHALAVAGRRGVDVRIVVPEHSNHRVADFARGAYLREMTASGCRVLVYPERMVHAKSTLIDDVAYVGSPNFDVRSMLLNFECALFLYDHQSVEAVRSWFEALHSRCIEFTPRDGFWRRLTEDVFRLGTPVL
ncbi:phospholipase D-like domain-containing protein [Pararhizobium mangrovi]|uniref:Phospholipase D n=1 Tax=Pararhizobium mangrovi TaxID=2590452 RepID=A0A506U938_9HYPH|nr:phospholipase D-like domain-containing protein [Pararhizobium mangrovi]TPW30400.1 cardiolipin synthetase [Pararhizobium mangrovi]